MTGPHRCRPAPIGGALSDEFVKVFGLCFQAVELYFLLGADPTVCRYFLMDADSSPRTCGNYMYFHQAFPLSRIPPVLP